MNKQLLAFPLAFAATIVIAATARGTELTTPVAKIASGDTVEHSKPKETDATLTARFAVYNQGSFGAASDANVVRRDLGKRLRSLDQ